MKGDDPVAAIKLLDEIAEKVKEFMDISQGLVDSEGDHPCYTVGNILWQCRNLMMQQYGKMLWYSPDGPINQSHGKDDLRAVQAEVLPKVRDALGAEAEEQGAAEGKSLQ